MKNKFNSIIHSFSRLDKLTKYVFFIIIVYLFVYESILTQMPAPNTTFYKIGKGCSVFIQIMYAWITGFIFYFINDHIKSDNKRISLSRITNNNNIYRLNLLTNDLLKEVCRVTLTNDNTIINHKIFSSKCDLINIYNTNFSTWYFGNISCNEFIHKYCIESRKLINDILTFNQLLDDEWINPLTAILNNINNIEMLLEINKKESKLDLVSYHIWNTYINVNNLCKLNSNFWTDFDKQAREIRKPKIKQESDLIYNFNRNK